MKLWQKIYLAVLLVCIIFINAGIYAVFEITYKKNIEEEQRRAKIDYSVIRHALTTSMQAMDNQGRLTDSAATNLAQLLENNYTAQDIRLSIWKDGIALYADTPDYPYDITDTQTKIVISGKKTDKTLTAVSFLDGFDSKYYFCVSYPLTELNETWSHLNRVYLCISLGISATLAIVLSLLLGILFRPLKTLTAKVREIGNGNYDTVITVRGEDEIALLAESINEMSKTIKDNIECLHTENEHKQQFIDDLSHEMKSPLTSIYGYAEYMNKVPVTHEEITELTAIIMEESRRMKDMSLSLLDLSSLRHHTPEMNNFPHKPFIKELAHTISARQHAQTVEQTIPVIWENNLADSDTLYGNRELLQLLILNLITNAIRACRAKKQTTEPPQITVCFHSPKKITVTDNGIGIPEGQLSSITEPFYRIDKGRSRTEGGNGLGLALCRQIAQAHRGELGFQSEQGTGTAVTITFS